MIRIRQARPEDIPVVEDILLDAAAWMDRTGNPQWTREQVSWERLRQSYPIDAFRIAETEGQPAGCIALLAQDPLFWPELPENASLFLHKLAVKRVFAGQGVSDALLAYAQRESVRRGIGALRLDCRADRPKVRALYERHGFVCVRQALVFGVHATVFYVWNSVETGEDGAGPTG